MSKRARYDGSEAVRVTWPPGDVYPEHEYIIEPNHQLPDDAPAALRDDLLRRDDFSEVNQATGGDTKPKSADTPKEG